MEDKELENFLVNTYNGLAKNFGDNYKYNYQELYKTITNEKLRDIFSLLHHEFINLFGVMNTRIKNTEPSGHYLAEDSRNLIKVIEVTLNLSNVLKEKDLAFEIDVDYYEYILKCKKFLKSSGGSSIPLDMQPIELYETIPIFVMDKVIKINNVKTTCNAQKILVGEGSYAIVHKFTDPFYNITFAEKKLKKNCSDKEVERFKREYDEMKRLSSPHIIEVYNYDDKANAYIMEYVDSTLKDYISNNNQTLRFQDRYLLVLQVLKAINYLHSKDILHRDISYSNILIKKYEDVVVVKISDFGLIKIVNSSVTSTETEFKGSLNDPELKDKEFKGYKEYHEMYPLGAVIHFIMTGREKIDINNIDGELKTIVKKCRTYPIENRYNNIDELLDDFKKVKEIKSELNIGR